MPGPLLIPVAAATGLLTLKSDTKPVKVYVRKPRGTLYWGGAGLNGPYIQPKLEAFRRAGIQSVNVGLTNTASQDVLTPWGTFIDAFRAGVLIRYEDDGEWVITKGMEAAAPQFNMIGYSYGSLLAAQTANFYARQGHVVDHLVLIGSPIDVDFLAKLNAAKNIRKVIVVDLKAQGDPIYAGITQVELVKAAPLLQQQQDRKKGDGHFFYAHIVRDSASRWGALAQRLVKEGLL
jgi:pimeloyl-ACP methyl ester carboxylesterase